MSFNILFVRKVYKQIGLRPCSVHDPEQAITYAKRLYEYSEEVKEDLMIVMRVYFEKCVRLSMNRLVLILHKDHGQRLVGKD